MRDTDPPLPIDRARAAAELAAAAEILEQHMRPGREKYFAIRNVREAIAELVDNAEVICRRCGQPFVFDAPRFRAKGLAPPRHCYPCRRARTAERVGAQALT